MGRLSREDVWREFKVVEKVSKNGKKTKSATCKACKHSWTNALVTRLSDHLDQCKKYKEMQEELVDSPGGVIISPPSSAAARSESMESVPVRTASSSLSTSSTSSAPKMKSKDGGVNVRVSRSVAKFMDSMSEEDNKTAGVLLSRAVYSTNSSFRMVKNEHWMTFFNFLRPSFVPPSPYQVGNTILNQEFQRVQDINKRSFEEAPVFGLVSDGWTNINGEGIINYIITTPAPVFFKSVDRKTDRETGAYVADEWGKIIEELGQEKFLVVVTDCALNMRTAWKLIEERYPHICGVGCIVHSLSNYMKDLMKLPYLSEIHDQCKDVVKEIKLSHVKKAAFKEKQAELYNNNGKALKLYPATRFAYVTLCLSSVLENKEALQATVVNKNLGIDASIRKKVLDEEDFWPHVTEALKLLKPIGQAIKLLERDASTLSEALQVYFKLKNGVDKILYGKDSEVYLSDLKKIEEVFVERFNMSIKPIHFACHLLDPRFCGRGLSDEQRISALTYINKIAAHLGLQNENGEVLANVGEFRSKTGYFCHEILWKSAKSYPPSAWWNGLCGEQLVTPLAYRLLQLPAHAIASERNWSQQADVHTPRRNKLLAEKVMKSVVVRAELNKSVKDNSTRKVPTLLEINKFLMDDDENALEISDSEGEDDETDGDEREQEQEDDVDVEMEI